MQKPETFAMHWQAELCLEMYLHARQSVSHHCKLVQ